MIEQFGGHLAAGCNCEDLIILKITVFLYLKMSLLLFLTETKKISIFKQTVLLEKPIGNLIDPCAVNTGVN